MSSTIKLPSFSSESIEKLSSGASLNKGKTVNKIHSTAKTASSFSKSIQMDFLMLQFRRGVDYRGHFGFFHRKHFVVRQLSEEGQVVHPTLPRFNSCNNSENKIRQVGKHHRTCVTDVLVPVRAFKKSAVHINQPLQ